MSLLTATQDDLKTGRGAPLPNRVWKFTVQQAATNEVPTGSELNTRLTGFRDRDDSPTVTLPNGDTYTPGRRIVFDRQWIDQESPKATEIGNRMIRKLALTTGVLPPPVNGKNSVLVIGDEPVDESEYSAVVRFASWEAFANALVGRDGLVRTKQVRAQTKNAVENYVPAFEDANGGTTYEAETNGVANTPKFKVEVADYLVA